MNNNLPNLCKLPWKELYVEQAKQGIASCCQQDPDRGVLKTNNLDDVFHNNNFLRSLRHDFLQGNRPSACSRCWDLEDQGLQSYRQVWNKPYNDIDLSLSIIDIRLGNKCNLACKMCTPEFSNQLAKKMYDLVERGEYVLGSDKNTDEYKNLQEQSNHIRSIDYNLIENIFQTIIKNPSVRQIKFGGGEPFIMPEVELLLTKLIEVGRTDLNIFSLTNCTTVKTSFLNLLSQFKSVDLACSIDGVGRWIEYQRTGSKWDSIKENFLRLQKETQFNVVLTPVITQLNLLGVYEFLEWAISTVPDWLAFNEIQNPIYFRWQLVPAMYRKELIESIDSLNLDQPWIDPNWKQFRKNLKTEFQTLTQRHRDWWKNELSMWDYDVVEGQKYFDLYPWGKDLFEGTLDDKSNL